MQQKHLSIALAGNPNSGKTTIFNNITGTRQKVGNWPGVTVEKKEGDINKFGYDIKIIDLPGTYSLTPFSIEEIVARNFVLDQHPDVVIDIIDASNLERSLYLATQLRELDCKVLFALNMADVAITRGIKIDANKLSELLDVPVVFTIGNKNEGIDTLLKKAIELAESGESISKKRKVKYNKDIENSIAELKQFLEKWGHGSIPYKVRWTAIKLLEDDKIVKERILQSAGKNSQNILLEAQRHRDLLDNRFDDDPEIVMTEERYGFIAGIIKEVHTTSTKDRIDISRNIDLVLTNRFVGFPIFILFIWAMFQLTFTVGAYPMEWIDAGINLLSYSLDQLFSDNMFKDLLLDGIIAGVGSVIVFLPNILILFFCIALFEDTGYMSRAAFLMDKIMHLIGLHGKSFIPMLMGFGCNVPAIMATRTLESDKDRTLTILITPFMSCSARLPVYIVLAGTFFASRAGTVIFAIYLMGIILSIITGRVFRSTLFRGADAPFVMELPPYRMPMLKSLIIHMWDRSKIFLKKMGGIILAGSIIVWALSAFPRHTSYSFDYDTAIEEINSSFEAEISTANNADKSLIQKKRDAAVAKLVRSRNAEQAEKSFMGRIGKLIEPLFTPLGIDWRGSVALLTGFFAKEIVVSTMGVMMIFVLLYVPCLATISIIRRETASLKWAAFSVVYSTCLAWGLAFCVYQGGKVLGFN
jgi:ferrous iron transport protein B